MNDHTQLTQLASLVLPPSIMDYFDVTGMDVEVVDPKPGDFYTQVVHIYLDEKDNRTEEFMQLRPNGFTEPTAIEDFPIRDRKLVLHVRRRRWLDHDRHSVLLPTDCTACGYTRCGLCCCCSHACGYGLETRRNRIKGIVCQDKPGQHCMHPRVYKMPRHRIGRYFK